VIVLLYYGVMRQVLQSRRKLVKCLTRCRDCGIFFFTDPRNKGRKNLRCVFGCRQAQQRENSLRRSKEYYDSAEGKVKKKIQNGKRKKGASVGDASDSVEARADAKEVQVDEMTVKHLQTVLSLIEGRKISREEILELVRQHSMGKGEKLPYAADDAENKSG